MLARLLTTAVGLPVLVAIVWIGGYWFTGLVVIVSAVASWELCRIAAAWGQPPLTVSAVVLTACVVASGHYFAGFDYAGVTVVLGGVSLCAAMFLLTLHTVRGAYAPILVTVCIVLFIGGALFNAAFLGSVSNGREWIFFLLAVTFATDTCAYIVGKAIGSRKLAPTVSPGKTWEGAIGGLVGATCAGTIFAWGMGTDWTWLLTAPILGVTGQMGDLYESKLKRLAGFDDSGTIFPGHGGVLDRLDSITFNLIVLGLVGIPLL